MAAELEQEKREDKRYKLLLTKLCTTRHCGIAHTATTKGLPTEHSAPKSCPILLLQPTWTVSRSSTHAIPRAGGSSERCFYGAQKQSIKIKNEIVFQAHLCIFAFGGRNPKRRPVIYFFCNCTVPSRPVTPRSGGLVRRRKKNWRDVSAHRPQQSTPTDNSKGPDQQCRWPQKTPLPSSTVPLILLFFILLPSSPFR
jgi:hypothetical protein